MLRRFLIAAAVGLVIVLAAMTGLYFLVNARTFQLAGTLVAHCATDEKVVALTLDDGPSGRTSEVLVTLQRAHIPATFYLVGQDLARNPWSGRQIAAAGHEIGNHSYTHRRLVFVTPATVREEVENTDKQIRATGFSGAITFRPPYGKKLYGLPRYLASHDRITVMWDVEPDSEGPRTREAIVEETVSRVHPGSIILLHVMYSSGRESLSAIPEISQRLQEQGYRFVTVSQLLATPCR
ncbi:MULTISPECIES: polysaccharide deacetylase family protein [unclassified Mycobacterium]|uniref:polysaccharide deacetylase family protein n=1 Tax=unclassified Mycobacterium TaxID=2642494 RepID=UPI002571037B|nr:MULTISPECIES: polysaccharide deacetylase family protein [unclassified Mycobacterium]